jgi:hypothetical protein
MHTDLNVSVFEFNRRSIRPHFELAQLFGRHVLQCTDPLSWNQEASIVVRDDLDGIPLGDVAHSLRPNFDLCFDPAGGQRCGVLGLSDLLRSQSRYRLTYRLRLLNSTAAGYELLVPSSIPGSNKRAYYQ